MKNKDTGNFGENLAAEYLIKNGFDILTKNWRYKHLEIDIIASKDQKLHIVEVKTRSTITYGHPEQFIGKQKFQFLKNAAAIYQYQNPQWKNIQFDVIAITLKQPIEILFLEDVFF
ncbi:MAG: YraN family protein [Sediminibacterium sp.]